MIEKSNLFSKDLKNTMRNGFVIMDDMRIDEPLEGSENKFLIKINNIKYVVKDSSFNQRRKQQSYAPYCEYVGSHFIVESGLLKCQNTFLGNYQGRIVVICEDVFNNFVFRPFKDLHQSSAGTDLNNKEYTYDDVLYVLTEKEKLSDSDFSDFKEKFWLMFLFDAILGNRDRHGGNWGFIKDGNITRLAPIIDNGSSLFPDVNLTNWKNVDFIKERVLKIPGSQFKRWRSGINDRPMRTNYAEVLEDSRDLLRNEIALVKELDIDKIIKNSTYDIPKDLQEWFYTIIKCRFRVLILQQNVDDVIMEELQNVSNVH